MFNSGFQMLVSFSAVSGICKFNRFMQMLHAGLKMRLRRAFCYLNGFFSVFYRLSGMLGKHPDITMLAFG